MNDKVRANKMVTYAVMEHVIVQTTYHLCFAQKPLGFSDRRCSDQKLCREKEQPGRSELPYLLTETKQLGGTCRESGFTVMWLYGQTLGLDNLIKHLMSRIVLGEPSLFCSQRDLN